MTPRRRAAPTLDDVPLARLPALPPEGVAAMPAAPSATDERRERELEEILAELGSDGRITVYHVIDGRSHYAGTMTLDGFNLEALLDTYGGGDKSLVIFQGRTKVDTVRVSLDPSIPARNPKSARLAAAPTAAAVPPMSEFAGLLGSMMTMQMQSAQMQQQMMTGMIAAVTSLLTARPEKDPMEVALRMAEIMKSANPSGQAMAPSEIFAVLERGMNIGKGLAGKGDDDGTMGVVKEGLGIVGKFVESQAAARAAHAPPALPAVVPVLENAQSPAVPAGAAGMPVQATDRPWVAALAASGFADKLPMAAKFMTPHAAADTIASNLSDDAFFDLLDDVRDASEPKFYGRLAARFPGARDIPVAWLDAVVAVLLGMEQTEADDSASDDKPASETPTT